MNKPILLIIVGISLICSFGIGFTFVSAENNDTLTNSITAEHFRITFVDKKGISYLFYSFPYFQQFSSSTNISSTGIIASMDADTKAFSLMSIPSLDKKTIYDNININTMSNKITYNKIIIDILSKNNTIINTVSYSDCLIDDYAISNDFYKDLYKFSGKNQSEIQETFIFSCLSFTFN